MIVDYKLDGDYPTIHKFIRDERGKRQHETVKGFEPYFFAHVIDKIPKLNEIKRVEIPKEYIEFSGLTAEVDINEIETINYSTDTDVFKKLEEQLNMDIRFVDEPWKGILDEPLMKIVLQNPKDTRNVRKHFSDTWESSIFFRTRYMVDEVDEIPRQDYRIVYYDIEVKGSLDVKNAPEPIISITAYDNYLDKYVSFLLNPEGQYVEEFKDDNWSLYTYSDERDMLLDFIDFIKDTNPDIITAWNGDNYDNPYLMHRMVENRVDYTELSPINEAMVNGEFAQVKGRAMIDMIPAFKKVYWSELQSYSLNNVAKELLGMSKINFSVSISELWKQNPEKLIKYNKRDVEIMTKLNDEFKVWDYLHEVQREACINLQDCIHNSRISEAQFMSYTEKKLPRKKYDKKDKSSYAGGKVLETTSGLKKNVVVLDLKAQYPSSMRTFNMSPEMANPNPEEVDDIVYVGNGVSFAYDELGFIPKVLTDMIKRRDEHKRLRNEAEPNSNLYKDHDRKQYALKFIINSIYGVMGYTEFPLYTKDVAKSTTHIGRETVLWAVDKSKEFDYEVIYGDTDSIMVSMGEDVTHEESVKMGEELAEKINESYDEYADEKGVDASKLEGVERKHFFELEAEKLYESFFMTDAKKKYAGKIVWKESVWKEGWDFAQYGKRSDIPPIGRKVQRELIQKILEGEDINTISTWITDICNGIKGGDYPAYEIGIPKKMKKPMDEYKTDSPVLRGTRFTNEYLKEEFGEGDKPQVIYVKSTPSDMPNTDVMVFQDIPPDEYGIEIDYDMHVEKAIRQKTKRIYSQMGWTWEQMYRRSSSLLDY